MAKKDKPEEPTDSMLTTAAKNVGKAAGKVAAAAGATPEGAEVPAAKRTSTKVPKLEKKNKSRLPRREKKARQKAEAVQP